MKSTPTLPASSTSPKLISLPSNRARAIEELSRLLSRPARSFEEMISAIAIDGGTALLESNVKALPVNRTSLTAGFNYTLEAKMLAYVRLGFTLCGSFVIQSMILDGTSGWTSHYYSADGKFSFSEGASSRQFESVPEKTFEFACPMLNFLYNLAAVEYPKTKEGGANTRMLHTIERILKRIEVTRGQNLSFNLGARDPAIRKLNQQLLELEADPVYTWKERQTLFNKIKEERATLISTKKRAHRSRWMRYSLPLLGADLKNAMMRFKIRPFSNFLGLLESILLDPVRWFFRVVRGNMGYSVALAIYSPFTFFFITQPMNPHAMWAVGKVRSAYIETTDRLKTLVTGVAATEGATEAASGSSNSSNTKSDTPAAATRGEQTTGGLNSTLPSSVNPSGHMPISSEFPAVANQNWEDRMSQFKAMQIAYEGNLEIAPRIGRLEQMETQLNWPLIVESTWLETERYLQLLDFLKSNSKDYAPEFIRYVENEKRRTAETQLYLWDRNIRFILDHPFTMLDESGEQTQMDHYVGRSFILLRDMTRTLSGRQKDLTLPMGGERIMELAKKFEAGYLSNGSVLERLKKNSKLFAQQDPQSTAELRSYMKRQWEVLYLLQNHAQEASNSGLQMYIWSVRNTVHLLQSLYSTKREELSLIALNFKKGLTPVKLSSQRSFQQMDSQYEALFHMMVLEFTSIRKELGEHLKNDIEAIQRKRLIDGLENFFKEREGLMGPP